MPVIGNLYPLIAQQAERGTPILSFMQERFTDIDLWRTEAREYLRSLLSFAPEPVALNPELVDHTDYPDYVQQKWYISSSTEERMPVILLRPHAMAAPAPAIVALHCHGEMYYFGKKKLLEEENEPLILTQYRQQRYDGVAIASELARRGYIVAVIDAFYFGERRLQIPTPASMQNEFLLAAEGSDQWLALLDRVSASMESTVAKSLLWAGATWPGIMAWDDMRTVDFLSTREGVDAERIGCIGLGMGGLRGALLGALDPRVNAVCIAGWMTMLADVLEEHIAYHGWTSCIPGLSRVLDWPDVAAMHAPNPLLVLQGSQDAHFPLGGYQKAAERLRAMYSKAGVPGSLDIGLFDSDHAFTLEMQRQAWAFFENAFGSSGD